MDHKLTTYIKADNNHVINEKYIRWIKKMGDCLEVCTKTDGCVIKKDTQSVCKLYSLEGFNRLNKHFTE